MTGRGRPDVWPSVEHRTDGPESVQPRTLPSSIEQCLHEPVVQHLLGFVQQGRRLERTLPPPITTLSAHGSESCPAVPTNATPAPGGGPQTAVVARKRSMPPAITTRRIVRLLHPPKPRGSPMCFFYSRTFAAQVGNGTGLKPAAVGHEVFDGDRSTHTHASRSLECVNRQRPGGIRQLGRFPGRPQAHALRHIAVPK